MMKRILYAIVVSMVASTTLGHSAGLMSNNENQDVVNQAISPEASSAIDSLSIVIGDVFGVGCGLQVRNDDGDLDIEQVGKIIKQIVNSPESKDYTEGMMMGVMIGRMFNAFNEQTGKELNKQLFMKHMKAELWTDDPIDESMALVLEDRIGDLADQITSNGDDQNTAIIDSLSIAMGTLYGARARNDEDFQNTDLEQLLKGIESATDLGNDENFVAGAQIGLSIIQSIEYFQRQAQMPLNKALLMEHFSDGLNNESISVEEYENLSHLIEPALERATELSPVSIANKQTGDEYMRELKGDKTYKFTKSGLAYKMLKEGKGKKFTEEDVVNVIYVGKHVDGTVFDSSDGEPILLSVHQVIPGFAEMLQLMKPGSKAIVVIPGELGYGAMGAMDMIGPNETLIFELETVGVQ